MSDPSAVTILLQAWARTPSPASMQVAPPASSKTPSVSGSSATASLPSTPATASKSNVSTTTSVSSRRASSSETRNNLDFEVVVAHYSEDLTWLKPVIEYCRVYSKGGPEHAPKLCFEIENLPNIGREGHTYLYHIVKNYESLKDVTLFTQARVDDHTDLTALEMKDIALKTKPGRVTTFPHRAMELFNLWDGIPWENYPCWAKWSSPEGEFKGKKAPKTPAQYFFDFFNNFGHDRHPDSIGFQPGAIFAVRRATIHQHPKELYQRMLEHLFLGEMESIDPETGHYLERFWPAMFRNDEYCCWYPSEVADVELNDQGQLAKGRWHETPRGVEVDVGFTNKP